MARAAARLRRALFLTVVVTTLALMHVERSLPQMRGRAPGPTQIIRLTPQAGGRWAYAVLGHEGTFQSNLVQVNQGRLIIRLGGKVVTLSATDAKRALPMWVGSLMDWVKTKLHRSDRDPGDGNGVLVLHDQEVDGHFEHLRLNTGPGRLLHEVDVG